MTLSDLGQRPDLAGRTAAVRRWAEHHGRQSRAAAELLIEHDFWLRRADFLEFATRYHAGEQMLAIRWSDAAEFAEQVAGSSTAIAVLELAAAIGSDRYRLASMGDANAAAIARAVAAAVGAAHQIGPAR